MTHHLHIKVRAILSDASAQSAKVEAKARELLESGDLSEKDLLFLEQDVIRNKILAAQAYALLASPETAPSAEREPEAPKDPEEPTPEEHSSLLDGLFGGNPLDLLDGVVKIGRAFTGPRPVKDTPQA